MEQISFGNKFSAMIHEHVVASYSDEREYRYGIREAMLGVTLNSNSFLMYPMNRLEHDILLRSVMQSFLTQSQLMDIAKLQERAVAIEQCYALMQLPIHLLRGSMCKMSGRAPTVVEMYKADLEFQKVFDESCRKLEDLLNAPL